MAARVMAPLFRVLWQAALGVSALVAVAESQDLARAAEGDLGDRVQIAKGSRPNDKGEGPTPNLARLETAPRRVGLVSFYVADKGSGSGTYLSSVREFTFLTQDGASHFAERYLAQGASALQAAFAAAGMELLTPDQFLDTDEKREAYRQYRLEMGRAARMLLGAMSNLEAGANSGAKLNQSAVAPGYRLLPAHAAAGAPAVANSLEELRQSLGLDALVIIRNGSNSNARSVELAEVQLMMYGPNPVPRQEGVRYIGRQDGHLYVDATLPLRRPAEVATLRRDAIASESYEGYERILAAVATAALNHVTAEIAKQ